MQMHNRVRYLYPPFGNKVAIPTYKAKHSDIA